MAGNEGGLPPKRRLGISKMCSVFTGLAGTEGVGGWKGRGCIAEVRVFFRVAIIRSWSDDVLFSCFFSIAF